MEIITILIPIAILLALSFVVAFIWMTMNGQYDDLETPAMRMLIDEKKLDSQNDISETDRTNKERK
jgi:cbb3-type cytochrome oxidase maturation protein